MKNLKYLCAVLNSRLIRWFLEQVAPTSGMGTLRWKKVYVQAIPVPQIMRSQQGPFVELVDGLLEAKAANPDADTSGLEEEIDWLVYELYGLTDEETAAVADRLWDERTSEVEDTALAAAIKEGLAAERVSREEVMAVLRDPDGG